MAAAAEREFHHEVEERKNRGEMVNWQVGETIVKTCEVIVMLQLVDSESQHGLVILKYGTKLNLIRQR